MSPSPARFFQIRKMTIGCGTEQSNILHVIRFLLCPLAAQSKSPFHTFYFIVKCICNSFIFSAFFLSNKQVEMHLQIFFSDPWSRCQCGGVPDAPESAKMIGKPAFWHIHIEHWTLVHKTRTSFPTMRATPSATLGFQATRPKHLWTIVKYGNHGNR